ncbi:hypothetical protein ACWCYY_38665 [Kitasatospora sp. NPDC001664]
MSRRRRYSGIVHFPWALPLDKDCLGLVARASIGEHLVDVAMPVVQADGALAADVDYRGKPVPAVIASRFRGHWGYRSTSRLHYVTAASASLLLHPHEPMAASPELEALAGAFREWFTIVREWASAWSGEPLADFDTSHDAAFHVPAGKTHMTGTKTNLGAVFFGARPLSVEQLLGAFRRASETERIPIEHRLLLTARDARDSNDTRKATIDAATAAEVALGSYITDRLMGTGLSSDFAEEMIKDVNGLVNLHALCTALGGQPGVSKGKTNTELATVRNHAAHRGEEPTPEEAHTAGQHAEIIVRTLRPLPMS